MASNLPKIGLQAIIEGATKFTKDLDSVNKRIEDATKKTKDAAKSASPLSKELDKMGVGYDSLKNKISQFTGVNSQAIDGFRNILSVLGPIAPVLLSLAGIAAVAGVAFIALGNRGASLIGLARAFDNLAASVGLTSQKLLIDLRKASAGTISDFKLIETANVALSGSAGDLGIELGKNLPRLLEIARTQAKVTGKDVDFLFNSIVEGIRKTSPLRIDNAGLIIKVGNAEEAYAQSIGKTVEQLTVEQKGIAILNATLEAGNAALAQSGNLQETNAEKISRVNATITNILDSLAVSVQPAFAVVLDGVSKFLGSIQGLVPYISLLLQGIGKIIGGIAGVLGGINFGDLAKNLFEGTARVFGSMANAIISVANQLIFPAVIGIAQFIADFLIGFSPPKMGPLSEIDKGGENLMLAWLEGIAGVSLDPVEQVTAEVNAALGAIGQASLPLVEARLAQLDKTLLPFQNRLDIVKSQFDAIAEPAKAALDAIDRQIQESEAALAGGDQAAAERIRQLDAAREAIQGQLDVQQRLVDQQQIQVGLATAAQAQERALLNIRKAALATSKQKAKADGTVGAVPGAATSGTGAAPGATPPENTGIMGVPTGPSALDLIGGQSGVNEAIAGIQDAFAGQIDTSQLALFQENQGALQTQLDRIGSVDLGAKLATKFKGLTDLFDPNNPESIPAKIGGAISTLTGDESVDGSIAHFFSNVGPNVEAALSGLGPALAGQFDPNVEGTPANFLVNAVRTLTGDDATADSLASFFAQLPENISNAASGLFDQLQTNVFKPVQDFLTGEGEGTLSGIIDGAVAFFIQLPSRVVEALKGIGALMYTALAIPVINAINGLIALIEGALKDFIGGIVGILEPISAALGEFSPQFLKDALANLRATQAGINFGRISTELPAFLQPTTPGAAKGGLFSGGLLRVGERGAETIFNADKIGVLPAELTRIIDGIGSILAQPAPMMLPAGNTHNESSSTYNFNGVQSDNDARRRYNSLRAGMR